MHRPFCFGVFLAILLSLACSSPSTLVSAGPPAAPSIDVFFSPKGGATEAVVHELGNAKQEILVHSNRLRIVLQA